MRCLGLGGGYWQLPHFDITCTRSSPSTKLLPTIAACWQCPCSGTQMIRMCSGVLRCLQRSVAHHVMCL
jgi:hypothetical protein